MTTGRIKEVTFAEGIETDPSDIVEIGATGWNSTATYGINDIVSYSGVFYRSLQNSNTNHQPDTNPTWWEVISLDGDAVTQTKEQASTPSNPPTGYYKIFVDSNGAVRKLDSSGTLEFLGGDIEWSSTRTFANNEVCSYLGIFYRSLQGTNLNQNPATQTAYWRPVSVTTEDAVVYKERTTAPTTPTTDQYKMYIKDDGKPYIINDAGEEKVIGGGLIVVEADHTEAVGGSGTDLTLAAGNFYVIDISGVLDADGNINTDTDTGLSVIDFNIEAGALESVVGVQIIGQSEQDSGNAATVYVRLVPNGVETIWEKETAATSLILGANASTSTLSWDTTKNWVSNTSDLFAPNTFLGTLQVDTIDEVTSNNGVQVEGRTNGNDIPAGYIGETKTWTTPPTTQATTTSYADWTNASITLAAGNYWISANVQAKYITGSNSGDIGYTIVAITDNSNNILKNSEKLIEPPVSTGNNSSIAAGISFGFPLELSSSETIKIRVRHADPVGTGSGFVYYGSFEYSDFYARRIG